MVETQGEGAFNLDGASEPYNQGARYAWLGDLTTPAMGLEKKSGIVAAPAFRLNSARSENQKMTII
jgi:hypothetical protein